MQQQYQQSIPWGGVLSVQGTLLTGDPASLFKAKDWFVHVEVVPARCPCNVF